MTVGVRIFGSYVIVLTENVTWHNVYYKIMPREQSANLTNNEKDGQRRMFDLSWSE